MSQDLQLLPRKNRFLTVMVSAGGVSLAVHALAFLRQVLIAAWFGISRGMDAYVMAYTLATMFVFTFANIFDSIAVPHLVRKYEQEGEEAARALAAAIARASLWLGMGANLLLLTGAYLLAPVIASGFSPEERTQLTRLVWSFLPWTLLSLSYYAHAAWFKARWRFNHAFAADIVVTIVSIGALLLWHGDIRALPLAYAAGYGAGLALLAAGARLWRVSRPAPPLRAVLRNIAELFFANQSGGLASLVDRHVQSYVPPGGVAAVNYAAQIVNTLATLLAFREIFVVPLAREADRAARLERLLCGLVLVSAPAAAATMCFAPEIVTALLQRGRFDPAAANLTASVLQISALSLVVSAIGLPLFRMFQIVDRIHLTHVMYLAGAASLALFGYLFVGVLGLGVRGVAWMQVSSSVIGLALLAYLVARCGIDLRWERITRYFAFAAAASAAGYAVATLAASPFANVWARLACGGAAFALAVGAFYFPARARLHALAVGAGIPEGPPV